MWASSCIYLSGVEVDKAVASGLSLQRPRLMKQEVKLFHIAELLQQLHQVIPAKRGIMWERAQRRRIEGQMKRNKVLVM